MDGRKDRNMVVVFKNRGGKTLTAINSGCKTTIKVHQKKIKCRRHKVFSDVTTYLLVDFVTFMFFCSGFFALVNFLQLLICYAVPLFSFFSSMKKWDEKSLTEQRRDFHIYPSQRLTRRRSVPLSLCERHKNPDFFPFSFFSSLKNKQAGYRYLSEKVYVKNIYGDKKFARVLRVRQQWCTDTISHYMCKIPQRAYMREQRPYLTDWSHFNFNSSSK